MIVDNIATFKESTSFKTTLVLDDATTTFASKYVQNSCATAIDDATLRFCFTLFSSHPKAIKQQAWSILTSLRTSMREF
jgi:3-methyladenine DNA glycosylase AlkC